MDQCHVLVVGAGPTGLMMASELRRYGMTCRIIDKAPEPSQQSKALAIQPRTLEILRFLDLDTTFLQQGKPIQALNILSETHFIGRVHFNQLSSPFPFILCLPQQKTEEILDRHLQSLGVEVERECELIDLEDTKEGVIASIQGVGQEKKRQIHAKWVMGCDGTHSFVRKHLNLPFEGEAFPGVFSLADIQLDWKYCPDEVFAFWSAEGVLAAIPLPKKGEYRLIFELERCQNQKQDPSPPTLEEVQTVVTRRADPSAILSHPKWLTNFSVNSRLVSRYQVGRYFLLGDAAHIHSPVGGQGMNTGLQDAFNLAWKLALVHQEKATAQLLESYQIERHAVASSLLKGTHMGTVLAALKKPWKITIRNILARIFLRFPIVQKKLIATVAQLQIQYKTSSLVSEKGAFSHGPNAGCRMPNAKLPGGDLEIYDLFHEVDTFFLFLFVEQEPPSLEPLLARLPFALKIYLLSKAQLLHVPYPHYIDHSGELFKIFGVKKEAAYVIRPDTYIGYRQTPIDIEALKAYFLQFLYC